MSIAASIKSSLGTSQRVILTIVVLTILILCDTMMVEKRVVEPCSDCGGDLILLPVRGIDVWECEKCGARYSDDEAVDAPRFLHCRKEYDSNGLCEA